MSGHTNYSDHSDYDADELAYEEKLSKRVRQNRKEADAKRKQPAKTPKKGKSKRNANQTQA